ncbi:hypothetical protein [Enhygromyxa salina]|uniref:hypothetical protein n=1 Tax=Enhygromyxa salina TaxID=215803 RepID=UPI000D02C97C|nr:hypothetical protein [Enhygromyxa salina]
MVDPPFTTDSDGPSSTPRPATGWTDLSVAFNLCALDADGAIWCGADEGDLRLVDEGPFVSVSQNGWGEPCGVTGAGTLRCDIRGSDGFELSEFYSAVSGSSDAGCGLQALSGAARCWPDATNVPGPFVSVGASEDLACGVLESSLELQCWDIDSLVFDEALNPPGGSFTRVVTSDHVGCALSTGGSIQCWGYDFSGLLSGGPPAGSSYVDLSIYDDGCAVTTTGEVLCWGDNAGDPNYTHLSPPAGVAFSRVSVGNELSCGIASDTSLHCW